MRRSRPIGVSLLASVQLAGRTPHNATTMAPIRECRQATLIAFVIASTTLFGAISGYRLNSKLIDTPPFPAAAVGHHRHAATAADTASTAFVKASIPMRIFQCMQRASILRCLKLFLLQRLDGVTSDMADMAAYANSGNVTADFLDRLLAADAGDAEGDVALLDGFEELGEAELNERLRHCLRRYFRHREIKLYFVPGMVVRVVPSTTDFLQMSVRKAKSMQDVGSARSNKDLEVIEHIDDDLKGGGDGLGPGSGLGVVGGGGGKNKYKHTEYLLQLGVPALMMPAILLGTVLPFLLPALKMATIMSTLINNGALLAAGLLFAKQAAFAGDQSQKVYYSAPGYHREIDDGF